MANRRSIAWGVAKGWAEAGAEVALVCQGERTREAVEQLVPELGGGGFALSCDVSDDSQIDAAFERLSRWFGRLDMLLHSIAFAPRRALEGRLADTARSDFQIAMDVSVYSLIALARRAEPLMDRGGSILSLSYYGAVKIVPNYNVMGVAKAALESATRCLAYDLGPRGIRVNCLSAGPISTLAARGIAGFSRMLKHSERKSPLRRNITLQELAATAVFPAGDGAAAITGQALYVDCGYQIMGM